MICSHGAGSLWLPGSLPDICCNAGIWHNHQHHPPVYLERVRADMISLL